RAKWSYQFMVPNRNLPQASGTFRNLPQPSAGLVERRSVGATGAMGPTFRNLPEPSGSFRKLPQASGGLAEGRGGRLALPVKARGPPGYSGCGVAEAEVFLSLSASMIACVFSRHALASRYLSWRSWISSVEEVG